MAGYWRNLSLQPGSGLSFPWAEYLGRRWDTADASLGPDGVNQGMQVLVYWKDLEVAVTQLLGYSVRGVVQPPLTITSANSVPGSLTINITSANHGLSTGNSVTISGIVGPTAANGTFVVTVIDANTFSVNVTDGVIAPYVSGGTVARARLSRLLPWRHPYWTQLWCSRISAVRGVQFTGSKKIKPIFGPFKAGYATGSPVSEFTLVLLTLQFVRPPYPVLDDTQVASTQEHLRFTDRHWTPSVQMLSREGQFFKYYEGNATGRQFPGSVGTKLAKAKLKRTWYQIPETCIYDSNGYPGYLIKFLGTVNSTKFLGIPAGVSLCEGIQIEPKPLQLPPELMGIVDPSVQLQYDITFHIEHFDPPLGNSTVAGVPPVTTRGHNTMPWVGDGLWYAVRSGAGQPPFQTTDHNGLFQVA